MSATTEVGHDAPSPRARLLVALAVGILAAIGVVVRVRLAPWHSGSGQTDFDYIWFAARSIAGTLVSIIVVAFLLRGAKRIFQDHAEQELNATKET